MRTLSLPRRQAKSGCTSGAGRLDSLLSVSVESVCTPWEGLAWVGNGMVGVERHEQGGTPRGSGTQRATCSQLQMGGRCKKKMKKTIREDKCLNSEWTKASKRLSGNLS